MDTPLFSIIIPTYNRSDLVQFAIRSALRQTFRDFEVVVSDNWSEDDTAEIVQGLRKPDIRYVRPPQHLPIPDHWEWARTQAAGRLVVMLADDDALSPIALERYAEVHRRYGADLMFSTFAEYRDPAYPGALRNTLECEQFPGIDRIVQSAEFVGTLFSFRPAFNMHPTAYAYSVDLTNAVAARAGRFFKTIGVEYYAWPVAAVLARRAVWVGVPLTITGRAAKSWGTNMVLINPGKKKIQQLLSDISKVPRRVPLNNYTFVNLMAEGILRAKEDFPVELGAFEFDEREYLRQTLAELRQREVSGVDVSEELNEVARYRLLHPELEPLEEQSQAPSFASLKEAARRRAKHFRDWVRGHEARRGFSVSGYNYGFSNIIECADFLAKVATSPTMLIRRQAPSRLRSGNAARMAISGKRRDRSLSVADSHVK